MYWCPPICSNDSKLLRIRSASSVVVFASYSSTHLASRNHGHEFQRSIVRPDDRILTHARRLVTGNRLVLEVDQGRAPVSVAIVGPRDPFRAPFALGSVAPVGDNLRQKRA